MEKGSFWRRSSVQRRLSKLVVSMFTVSSLMFSMPTSLHVPVGISKASAVVSSVADQPNLGQESYWNFYQHDLGAGWIADVNTATGNFILNNTLFVVPGRSIPLSEGLTYNAKSQQNIGVGLGWTIANGLFLQENTDGSVTLKDEDATNHTFTKNTDGSYKAPAGVHLTLSKVQTDIFTIVDKDQSIFRFEEGRLISIKDERGAVTNFSYDANGNLSTVTDPSGRKLTYTYDTNGRLESITDPANRKIQFAYDTTGKLVTLTDSRNNQTRFEYDSSNRLNAFIDANSRKTSFSYDSQQRIVKIMDARSTETNTYDTNFAYDDTTRTTTITDPAAKTMTYIHNTAGNVVQFKNGVENTFTYEWNNNELNKVNDSKGATTYQYDGNGNVTQVSDTISSTVNSTTNIVYDSKNNPVSVTNANQYKTESRYNSNSNEISTVNPHRLEADGRSYDANGNVTSHTHVGAPTTNRIENGNFERLDGTGQFIAWHKGGNTASISADSTIAAYGYQSVKISNSTSTTAYLYSDAVPVLPGEKITFTSTGSFQNISGTIGANIGLEFYDANFNFLGDAYSNSYQGTGNANFTVTETAPANSAYVYAIVENEQASGIAWFDGAQLVKSLNQAEGYISTKFDFVENSSFERDSYLWSAGGSGTTGVTTETAWAGSKSVKINLTTSGSAWFISEKFPVAPGEPITFSGFIKTVGVSGNGADITIDYYDSLGGYLGYVETEAQTGTQEITRYTARSTPPANAVSARIYAGVWSSTGTAYFDNLKVTSGSTTLYGYDSSGNYLTSTQDASGNLTQFTYDTVGNLTSTTDPKSNKTSFAYDGNNNLTSVTDPLLKVTRYQYDPVNLQVDIRDARSSSSTDNTYRTTFGYNELNQITSMTDPLGRTTSHTYNASGNKESTTYPNGQKVTYSYDAANLLTQKSYSGSTENWNFSYDTADNLTQVTDEQTRSYSFSYDGANRLTKITNPFGYYINYQLDNYGNIKSSTDVNNKTISYSYGSDNRLLSLTDPSGRVTQYHYDESGHPFLIIRGHGGKSIPEYDSVGRVKEIADPGNPGGSVYSYQYDANGNISTIDGGNGKQTFAYDSLNRLTSWTNETGTITSYQYDAVGNLTKKGSKTFTYNADNQITNTGFTYDSNGNMTSNGTYNYSYNHENQLVKVTKVSDGSTVATYTYDYRGLRISKTTPSGGTIYYHWDEQGRLVRESDANGNTLSLYIYAGNQLIAVEKGGAMYYVHTNHRGDILALTDVNKNRVATYTYGPWGEFLGKTGTVDIPFRYAGYYYDNETGLYYLKARYYSPDLGRFLTKDQIEYGELSNPTSLNLYVYANDNPMIYVDPDGTSFELIKKFYSYVALGTLYLISKLPGIQKLISAGKIAKLGTSFGKSGTLVQNPGIKVDWGQYSSHGFKRLLERNVSTDQVNQWVRTGKALKQGENKYLFVTKEGAAVVDNGRLVTVMPKSDYDDNMQTLVKALFGK